jgi:DNA-binding beta-propeller fold protein YncE
VGGFVFAINSDGSGITQIGPQRYTGGFSTEHRNTIASFDGNLYIADSGRSGVTLPEVLTIPTTGGSFTTLFAGSPFIQPTGIAVGNNTIFIADDGANAIFSLPLTGGTPTLLVSDPRFASLSGLTFFNNALYVADGGTGATGTIFKVDLSPVVATAVPEPGSFLVVITGIVGLLGYGWKRRKLTA